MSVGAWCKVVCGSIVATPGRLPLRGLFLRRLSHRGRELLGAGLGATIPIATIEGAPADAEMAWPPVASGILMLPKEAQTATGMTHLTIYWEPQGHPPAAVMTPHFDFHFYDISPERRVAIDCANVNKPAALPAGFILPDEEMPGIGMLVGICVPEMGMHSLLQSAYNDTTLFDATMVVGYYGGSAIFSELMIGRAYLLKK